MTKATVTSKSSHYTSKQLDANDIALKEPSVVALNLKQEDIAKIEYIGNAIVITLKNGEKITIDPVNVVNGQLDTDVVLTTDKGQFEHLLFKQGESDEWIFEKYIRLNTIDPLLESDNLAAWVGLGAGLIGTGIALANSSGGDGKKGDNGLNGTNGKSAYQVAVDLGYKGSEQEWLQTLVGKNGINGLNGVDGKSAYDLAVENGYKGTKDEWIKSLVGKNGTDGIDGADGLSVYEIAVKNGFVGTESEWLLTLVGKDGSKGDTGLSAYDLAVKEGFSGTLTEWLQSLQGKDGVDGKSAYELAVENGYAGTEQEWLESLVGKDGINGINGADGKSAYDLAVENGYKGTKDEWIKSLVGKNGTDGIDGADGLSVYEIAVKNGFVGTESEWLLTLVGKDGSNGTDGSKGDTGLSAYDLAVKEGFSGTLTEWLQSLHGTDGVDGKSAYELAVEKGYTGTEQEWLESLVGKDGINGINGTDGKSAYDLAVENGYTGTEQEWLQSLVGMNGTDGIDGADGLSVYEIAVKNGFDGSESAWLLSLVGKDGSKGDTGLSAYDLAVQEGFSGTLTEWLQSLHGTDGVDGKSAYELAVEKGYTGTEQEWLESLVGKDGINGINGTDGKSAYDVAVENGYTGTEQEWLQSLVGMNGTDGIDGADGLSVYEIAVKNGFVGTESEWLLTLVGKDGSKGDTGLSAYDLAVQEGFSGTLTEWLQSLHGTDGVDGKSAYELAVEKGYTGTEQEWLESLVGKDGINGINGTDGKSAYDVAVENGYTGTEQEWLQSLVGTNGTDGIDGADGLSVYEIAVKNGFVGTESEWLLTLVGKDGSNGADGSKGDTGLSAYDLAVQEGFSGTLTEWLQSLKAIAEILQTPVVTYNNEDQLSGTAVANSTVHIVNSVGDVITVKADASGNWELKPNPLEFKEVGYIYARNDNNEQSINGVVIGKDTVAPSLTVDENNMAVISGTTNKFHEVLVEAVINGVPVAVKVIADENGHWSIPSSSFGGLIAVNTPILVTAKDVAGNKTSQSVLSSGVSIETIVKNGSDFIANGVGAKNSTIEFVLKDGSTILVDTDDQGNWTTTTKVNLFAEDQINYSYVEKSDGYQANGSISQTVNYPNEPLISENTTFVLSGNTSPNTLVKVVDSNNEVHTTISDVNGNFRFEPNPLSPTEVGFISAENTTTGLSSTPKDVVGPNWTTPDAPIVLLNTEAELAGNAQVNTKVVVETKDGAVHEVLVAQDGTWSFEPSPVPPYEIAKIYSQHIVSGLNSIEGGIVGADNTPPMLEVVINNINIISGTAEANSTVVLKLGNSVFTSIKADANGNWSFTHDNLKLVDADITVVATDVSNNSTEKHVISSGIRVTDKSPTTLFGVAAKDSVFTIIASNGETYTVQTNSKGEWVQDFQSNPYSFTKVDFIYTSKPDGFTSSTYETYYVQYPSEPRIQTITLDMISGYGQVGNKIVLVDSEGNKYETAVDSNGVWAFPYNPLGENELAYVYAVNILTQLPSKQKEFNNIDGIAPQLEVLVNTLSEVSGIAEPNATIILTKVGSTSEFARVVADENGAWKFDSSTVKAYLAEIGGVFTVVAQDSWQNTSDAVPLVTSGIQFVQHNVGIMEFKVIPNTTIIVTDGKKSVEYTADSNGLIKIVPNDFAYRNVVAEYKDKSDNFTDKVIGNTINNTTDLIVYATSKIQPSEIEIGVFADLRNDVRIYDDKGNLIYSANVSNSKGVTRSLTVSQETLLEMGDWVGANGTYSKNITAFNVPKNIFEEGKTYTISSGTVDNIKSVFTYTSAQADANSVETLATNLYNNNYITFDPLQFKDKFTVDFYLDGAKLQSTALQPNVDKSAISLWNDKTFFDNFVVTTTDSSNVTKTYLDTNKASEFKIMGWDGHHIWGYLPPDISEVEDIYLNIALSYQTKISQLPIKINDGYWAVELPTSLDGQYLLKIMSVGLMVGGNIINVFGMHSSNNGGIFDTAANLDIKETALTYHQYPANYNVGFKGEVGSKESIIDPNFEFIRNISSTEVNFKLFYNMVSPNDYSFVGNYIQIRDAHTLEVINEQTIRMNDVNIKHNMVAGGDYLFYVFDSAGNANAPLFVHINEDWSYYTSNKLPNAYEENTQNYIYDLLVFSDNLGGHEFKEINGADVKDTNIDLKDLLAFDYDKQSEDINDFLKVVLSEDGKNTIVSVDRDGLDGKYHSEELFVLNNVQTTLDELLQNNIIIV